MICRLISLKSTLLYVKIVDFTIAPPSLQLSPKTSPQPPFHREARAMRKCRWDSGRTTAGSARPTSPTSTDVMAGEKKNWDPGSEKVVTIEWAEFLSDHWKRVDRKKPFGRIEVTTWMVWILIVHDSSTDSLDRWLSRQILWIRCQLIAERGLWNQWKSVDVCLPGCDCFGGNPKQEVDEGCYLATPGIFWGFNGVK